MLRTELKRKIGRPCEGEHPMARDGYTLPVDLKRKFQTRCRELRVNKSQLIRDWIEWFLDETEGNKDAGNSPRIP